MTDIHSGGMALAIHVLCLLAGVGLGWALARCGGRLVRSRAIGAVFLVSPLGVALVLTGVGLGIGFHDLMALATLFGVGLIAGRGGRLERRGVVLVGASAVFAALVAEGMARLALPPLPPYTERGRTVLFVEGGVVSSQAQALFPDLYEEPFRSRVARERPVARQVLVVGDSIVEGEGAGGPAVAFPAALERLDPATSWVNAGFSGTGPDFYFRVVEAWVKRLSVQEVLLVFYTGNDLSNIGEPWAVCGGGPLLHYEGGRATSRCTRPQASLSLAARIALSPPPLLLRAATSVSLLARHACLAVTRVSRLLVKTPEESERWTALEVILRTLRDDLTARGIRFRVLLFPFRPYLEDPRPEHSGPAAIGERVAALCRALGIPLLDAGPFLREMVASEGVERWFLGGRGSLDPHLTSAGHARLAAWLREALQGLGQGPAAAPTPSLP